MSGTTRAADLAALTVLNTGHNRLSDGTARGPHPLVLSEVRGEIDDMVEMADEAGLLAAELAEEEAWAALTVASPERSVAEQPTDAAARSPRPSVNLGAGLAWIVVQG